MSATPRKALSDYREPPIGGHIATLDGIRGLAVLCVLAQHLTLIGAAGGVDYAVRRLAVMGWVGVELFFVLSGFLITGILYDTRTSGRFFTNFYARRVLRIFPLYYGVLVALLVVLPLLRRGHPGATMGAHGQWWYWLYCSNFLIAKLGTFLGNPLDVSWSLAIEEQFYIVWPLIIFLSSRRTALGISLLVILGSWVARIWLSAAGKGYPAVYVLTYCRMDGLALGAVIALLARSERGLLRLLRPATILGLLGVVSLMPVLIFVHLLDVREYTPTQTLVYGLVDIACAAALVHGLCAGEKHPLHRILSGGILRMFGKYSYAMYLLHLPMVLVLEHVYPLERFARVGSSQLLGQVIFWAMAIACTLGIAWLSWHLFEKRFLVLKRYFPERRHRSVSP